VIPKLSNGCITDVATSGAVTSVQLPSSDVDTCGRSTVAPTFGTTGVIVELVAISGAWVAALELGVGEVTLIPSVGFTAATTVLGTVVCAIALLIVELIATAATFGEDDSIHKTPSDTDGSIIVAPAFGTEGMMPDPIAGFIVTVATSGHAADNPNPKVDAIVSAATLGVDKVVILLDVESIGA
jgi:hypothetical protein